LDFARAFRAKFPAWAQAYEQQAQSDTNKPPFTKEAQAVISALATEVEKAVIGLDAPADSAAGKPRKGGGDDANRAVKQFEVLAKLERIRELLPKDGNGGGQNQNNQNDQNRQDGQNNQDGQNDKQPDGDSQENDQPEKSEGEQKPEEKQPESAREEKDDGQVEDMIRKAQERSDEHDAEKKARMKNAPLPPNERDW
jgi:cobalamin biosynthesis protein CobT